MNIGIFGQHPQIKRGFNSAMTMNWVKALSMNEKLTSITLYINDEHQCDIENLNKWDKKFQIKFLKEGESFSDAHDAVIWQTYHSKDHKKYWEKYKSGSYLKVKNFPRFFTGTFEKDKVRLNDSTKAFDIIMFSLHEDFVKAQFIMPKSNSYFYVPRGFPAKELKKSNSSDDFVISVDVRKASNINKDDYKVYISANEILKKKNINVVFQVLGKEISDFKLVARSGASKFYSNFINSADVYMFVDRTENFQDSHYNSGGLATYCGVYENTVIEAQVAGLMVIGPDKLIANELLINGYNGIRLMDDKDPILIAEAVEYCYENHFRLSEAIRQTAISKNSLSKMAKNFFIALDKFKGV